MAKSIQALAHGMLSIAYMLECVHFNHVAVNVLLALAYLAIAIKYTRDTAGSNSAE